MVSITWFLMIFTEKPKQLKDCPLLSVKVIQKKKDNSSFIAVVWLQFLSLYFVVKYAVYSALNSIITVVDGQRKLDAIIFSKGKSFIQELVHN